MIALLADANIQGHIDRLVARMRAEHWREYWILLELQCLTFDDVGLDPTVSDAAIWHCCQHHTPESLPVFTIGDADSLLFGPDYSDRVIESLLQYLLQTDNIRGTGRLYLP